MFDYRKQNKIIVSEPLKRGLSDIFFFLFYTLNMPVCLGAYIHKNK